ncbi:MAG: RusA family crossover junction endodeoxyribonuclease [Balneola sp.]
MNYSSIIRKQPKSYNSWKKNSPRGQQYLNDIRQSFSNLYQNLTPKSGDLYGIAYYFHSINTGTDADNISKPIWDSLTGFLYQDDKQVKLRIAGSIDLNQNDFNLLDITGVPGNVVVDLIDAINNEQHVVFIECGSLDMDMYKFNLG